MGLKTKRYDGSARILANRKQCRKVNGQLSDLQLIKTGAP